MKKSVFFVAALALALTACGDNNKAASDQKAAADKAAAASKEAADKAATASKEAADKAATASKDAATTPPMPAPAEPAKDAGMKAAPAPAEPAKK